MSSPQFTRAQNDINRWVRDPRIPINQSDADMLVACLDPCHDTMLANLDGWPDLETGASVVRCVKQSLSISATSGSGPAVTAPWDLHINLQPFLNFSNIQTTLSRVNNIGTVTAADTSNVFGGLTCTAAFNSGQAVDYFTTDPFSALGNLDLPAAYSGGLSRVTGIAFEVVDTTAVLNQQGSCFVWRQMDTRDADTCNYTFLQSPPHTVGQSETTSFDGVQLVVPPLTVGQAMLIPGTRTWASKEGCYVVGCFHSAENPPIQTNYVQPIMVEDNDILGSSNTTKLRYPVSPANVVVGTTRINAVQPQKIYPYHSCGAIFAGLNPLSTFRLSLVIYVESFPTIAPEDQAILVMAKPSMAYNPYLLELLSHSMQTMPVGVMFKENGLGTWFATAVRAASKYLSAPASLVNPLLGMAVKAAGEVANGYLQPAGQPTRTIAKRKKVQNKNVQLANRKRGGKNAIQGPKNRKVSNIPKKDISQAIKALKNLE